MNLILGIVNFILSSIMLMFIAFGLILFFYFIIQLINGIFGEKINIDNIDFYTARLIYIVVLIVLIFINLLYAINNDGDFFYIIELIK